jgi:hypothetical protein
LRGSLDDVLDCVFGCFEFLDSRRLDWCEGLDFDEGEFREIEFKVYLEYFDNDFCSWRLNDLN